jgi:hypothetical protein
MGFIDHFRWGLDTLNACADDPAMLDAEVKGNLLLAGVEMEASAGMVVNGLDGVMGVGLAGVVLDALINIPAEGLAGVALTGVGSRGLTTTFAEAFDASTCTDGECDG